MQVFFQKYDGAKIVDYALRLNDIDTAELSLSPREKLMQAISQPPMQGAPDANGGGTGKPGGTAPQNAAAAAGVMA